MKRKKQGFRLKDFIPKSPVFKMRENSGRDFLEIFGSPDNEFDIMIKKPLTGFKRDRMDKVLDGRGKFKKVRLW